LGIPLSSDASLKARKFAHSYLTSCAVYVLRISPIGHPGYHHLRDKLGLSAPPADRRHASLDGGLGKYLQLEHDVVDVQEGFVLDPLAAVLQLHAGSQALELVHHLLGVRVEVAEEVGRHVAVDPQLVEEDACAASQLVSLGKAVGQSGVEFLAMAGSVSDVHDQPSCV
jgi:hypothetical protein